MSPGYNKEECAAAMKAKPEPKYHHQRVVVCAANRSRLTGQIVCGARHWDSCMRDMVIPKDSRGEYIGMPDEWICADQGFIDQAGVWMDRQEAYEVAEKAGQIKYGPEYSRGTLYSEDLY
jgi:hypothetical protein